LKIRIKQDELNPYYFYEDSTRTTWGRFAEVTEDEHAMLTHAMWQFRLAQQFLSKKYNRKG